VLILLVVDVSITIFMKSVSYISHEDLNKILPNGFFKISKSPKLKVEDENLKFEIIFGYLSARDEGQIFLFESVDFSRLFQSNLAKFFNYVELSDLNESLFNFIKGLLLNP
jgi:hypothetical protein